MDRPPGFRGKLEYAGQLLALAAVYVLLGWLGPRTARVVDVATLVWPAAGVALAALVLGGYRLWPAVTLGAFVTNLLAGTPPLVTFGIAIGMTLEILVGAWALQSVAGCRGSLDRFKSMATLVVLAGLGSTLLGASLGALSLRLGGLTTEPFAQVWSKWWAGDFLGIVIIAPLLLTWVCGPHALRSRGDLLEAAALGACLLVGSALVFAQTPPTVLSAPVLQPYVLFLPLLWAALRFGTHGAATGNFLVSVAAIWATAAGFGPFVRSQPAESFLALHIFLGSAAVASLALGAVVVERERSIQALHEQGLVLRTVIDGATDAIYVKDAMGRFATVNAAGTRLFGMRPEDVIGKDAVALFSAEEASAVRKVDQEVWRTGQSVTVEEPLMVEGKTRVLHTTKAPYRDHLGRMIGIIGISRDITFRKTEELARARLAAIVESSADAVFGTLLDGTITSWNEAAARMSGFSPEEAIGHSCDLVFPPDHWAQLHELIARIPRGERIVGHETVWCRKDGSPIEVALSMSPLRDSSGNIIGVSEIARDITEQKRVELERNELLEKERAARAEAQAATRAKDEFLAVLSHELRSPLQAMLGWTLMLKERPFDERLVRKGLETIDRNVKTQAQLIDDLLDISRIVAGKLRLTRQRVELEEIVAASIESAKLQAEAKSIQLEATAEPLYGEVIGDPGRLQQVVSNLLSNALKFTPPGGHVRVRLERHNAAARLVVEDSGRGIAPEFLPRVFDRFRQEESTTSRAYGGLGLGLAIVRHMVELHGGEVKAESPGEGKGATFTVTLPLVRAELRALVSQRRRSEQSPIRDPVMLNGVRIVLVDDEQDARELLETVLRNAGAEVYAVDSVSAAIEALESFRPHLLLSDIGMPGEDGYTLIRRVRAKEKAAGEGHLPAVALTAFASQADREQALALGFEEHMTKPASPAELTRTVARLAGRAA